MNEKYRESVIRGYLAENHFVNKFKEEGWDVKEATKEQNMFEHFDYILTKDGKEIKVDVKAEKKISRQDFGTQTERLWIELQNVRGDIGWLYGKSDVIAFQNGEEYLMIPTVKLAARVESLIKSEYVSRSSEALYRLYRRSGRNDLITMVYKTDIEDLHEDV